MNKRIIMLFVYWVILTPEKLSESSARDFVPEPIWYDLDKAIKIKENPNHYQYSKDSIRLEFIKDEFLIVSNKNDTRKILEYLKAR